MLVFDDGWKLELSAKPLDIAYILLLCCNWFWSSKLWDYGCKGEELISLNWGTWPGCSTFGGGLIKLGRF